MFLLMFSVENVRSDIARKEGLIVVALIRCGEAVIEQGSHEQTTSFP